MKRNIIVVGALAVGMSASLGWAYDGAPVADGGSISGQVKLQGAAPAPKPIEITKDKEVCGVTPKVDETLIVGAGGGVKNAVVSLTNITKGKPMDTSTPTLDQHGCQYVPHILMTRAGATVTIVNSDGILHNIHTYGKKNPPVNRAQPKFKKTIEEKFDQPETFEVKCDAHGWMEAWVVVQDHPYYAVTDDAGAYKLTDVPPGEYEVKVWHGKLGEKTQKVTVAAKAEAKADFELAAK